MNQLRLYLSEKVALPVLNPQSAIFGFTDVLGHNFSFREKTFEKCNGVGGWFC